MTNRKKALIRISGLLVLILLVSACDPNKGGTDPEEKEIKPPYSLDEFVMGVDLSYLNEVMAKGGIYADQRDPYALFAEEGANVARIRLWNNPTWIRDLYQNEEETLYSGFQDVVTAARRVKGAGMEWCLDFHYSDNWADPGKQNTPEAWKGLEINTLTDSVYQFTYTTLATLKALDLSPAFIQIGNEINSGILHPTGHYLMNDWKNLGQLVNAGIRAVRAVYPDENAPQIILHVAQPENIRWFFNGLTISGGVTDFDVIGVSYYPVWSEVPLVALDGYLRTARNDFGKEVMIMETAFPWTNEGADNYNNIMGGTDSIGAYPVTTDGQLAFMATLCQEVIDAGGLGVFYWEPGWISCDMITQWGTGSSWENCTFFNFQDNNSLLPVVQYLTQQYQFQP